MRKRDHTPPSAKEPKRESLIQSLKLPKDSMLGASIVTVTGNSEAFIENYKGMIEYTDETILLQGKTCRICIQGKKLSIDYYTNEDMKISGRIHCVQYL
ncbi:MAG: YabP/YqfC family sporulation protein [Lachnospiraceae bacterium]|jgi:sporulation protein YqfC|nr:YabP/YqfC family sporulation protein [Lachnospiraceae bacterium]